MLSGPCALRAARREYNEADDNPGGKLPAITSQWRQLGPVGQKRYLPNFAAEISFVLRSHIATASVVSNALIVVLKTGPGCSPARLP